MPNFKEEIEAHGAVGAYWKELGRLKGGEF